MLEASAVLTEGLSVRLGSTQVLEGVDLRVDCGDLYGLLGRNGAGKTTSMRAFLGLLPQSKGRCEIFGQSSTCLRDCPEPIAVALDPPGLDDTLTVRQNLELARIYGGIQGGRSVDDALQLVGLAHRAHHRGDRLSHGQGRRAAVARALLGDPRLLVLDEPLSGLDPEGVEVLIELFRRLTAEEGVTVVLSSHHLREVEAVCTRVGMIEGGKTVLEGEVAGLLAEAGDGLRVVCRDGAQAKSVLQADATVSAITSHSEGDLFVLKARWSAGSAPSTPRTVLEKLVQAGCGVEEFVRERASLVDVFQAAVREDRVGLA
ncbi:MAG: ABC transporter ATP-binding protein [Planctomycetes bacterium]|nr:ABC transporter ATP-binding protein [Planctomycetota bacterium]